MTFDDGGLLSGLSQHEIRYKRRNGNVHVFGRIVFGMTLFMRDPQLEEVQERAVVALHKLREMIPDTTYRWFWTRSRRNPKLVSKEPPGPNRELLEAAKAAGDAFSVWLWDAEDAEYDAPAHDLKLMYQPVDLKEGQRTAEPLPMGSLQVTVPIDWMAAQAPGWPLRTFVELCRILDPWCGWAGYHLNTPYDNGALQQNRGLIHPILKRFPGLNSAIAWRMPVPMNRHGDADGGLATVDWLTAVDARLVARCGGEEALRRAFGQPDYPVWFTGNGGVVVQAGSAPTTGDREAGIGVPRYGHVSRFFRPVRILDTPLQINPAYFADSSRGKTEALRRDQNEWLERFDND